MNIFYCIQLSTRFKTKKRKEEQETSESWQSRPSGLVHGRDGNVRAATSETLN